MGIFNRKKKEEDITELKNTITEQEATIQKVTQQQETILLNNNETQTNIEKLLNRIKEQDKKFIDFETKFSIIQAENNTLQKQNNNLLVQIQEQDKKVNHLKEILNKTLDTVKSWDNESVEETVDSDSEVEDGGHLYKINGDYAKPYSKEPVVLEDGTILIGKRKFHFKIDTVINIKNNLQKYHDNQWNIKEIGDKYNIYYGTIYRVIWNIEEGTFDKVIQEYEKLKKANKPHEDNHIRRISNSLKKPQRHLTLGEKGIIKSNGKTLKYKIDDVISLKKKIPNTKDYPTLKSLYKTMPLSEPTVGFLIWNIEEGNYDKIIKEYEARGEEKVTKSSSLTSSQSPSSVYHIYKLSKSYQVPLRNLRVDSEGKIYNKINQRLPYNIYDIIEIKKRIYSGKYKESHQIFDDYEITNQLGNKLIWNIEEGNFDDLIDEFNSRNYTYENKNNRLYIDDNDTKLTIGECNIIIDCLVNEPNKHITINKLIKTYSNVDPKYIRLLGEEYNNPNLTKVLLKKVNKVERVMVNNPQKRKEQGY